MPRGPTPPVSRNIHHGNLKTKHGKTFVTPVTHKPTEMRTRSAKPIKQVAEIVADDTVIISQPPKKAKKNPKLETHFTIPNIKANQEMLMSHKLRAVTLMDEVVRELDTTTPYRREPPLSRGLAPLRPSRRNSKPRPTNPLALHPTQ